MINRATVEHYALLQKFKAEQPEVYWKAFAIWLDWYALEGRMIALRKANASDWSEVNQAMCAAFEHLFYSTISSGKEARATDQACIYCWNEGAI